MRLMFVALDAAPGHRKDVVPARLPHSLPQTEAFIAQRLVLGLEGLPLVKETSCAKEYEMLLSHRACYVFCC